jgi:hypothetical protein
MDWSAVASNSAVTASTFDSEPTFSVCSRVVPGVSRKRAGLQHLFQVCLSKGGANVALIVSATERAAEAVWPTLEKVDEGFEFDF